MKDKALELMAASNHCVISTIGPDNQPEAALVGFSEDKDLKILIGTGSDTRKCKNIASNPNVAVVIADEQRKLEVQYEGKAVIYKAEDIKDRLEAHFKKLPSARARLNDPNQAWIIIEPNWIRFADLSQGYKLEEMRLP